MIPDQIALTFEGREKAVEAYNHYRPLLGEQLVMPDFPGAYLVSDIKMDVVAGGCGPWCGTVTLHRVINASGKELDAPVK